MTTRIFTLSGGASVYRMSPDDVKAIARFLDSEGEVHVVYNLEYRGQDWPREVRRSVRQLEEFLRPIHEDFTVERYFPANTGDSAHVHVFLESDVIHFSAAPWGCGSSDHDPRLLEMVRRGRPFTAVYIFPGRADVALCGASGGRADGSIIDCLLKVGLKATVRVTRVEVPPDISGQCRIDLRIEPRKE